MNEQTEKTILAAALEGAKYDECAGELFLNKEIVAPILQMVIPEYDLMTVVIIRRGQDTDEKGIWDYLQGIFSSDIITMKKYSDVSWSNKLEQEVHRMCGLGESIYQKGTIEGRAEGRVEGRAEGRVEGRAEGRREMIKSMLSSGKASEEIASFANIPLEEVKEAENALLTNV